MGVDYLKRFDWGLAARIQRMGPDELAGFLADRSPAWRSARRRPSSEVLSLALRSTRPIHEILQGLLDEGCTLTELRNDAIYDLCLQGDDVPLDPWGSWAVFENEPEDALSSLDVLPGTDEELFLLLRPRHLDVILRSLSEHAHELAVRSHPQIEAVARLRDACASRPDMLVAYCFDA